MIGSCSIALPCSGGDDEDTTTISGDVIHIFTTIGSATLTCTEAVTAQILVVAGGGASGGQDGGATAGGGGGGGVEQESSFSLSVGTYTITVGNGGTGVATSVGDSGGK